MSIAMFSEENYSRSMHRVAVSNVNSGTFVKDRKIYACRFVLFVVMCCVLRLFHVVL